jgi:ceramide glucosyltransferase
MPSGLRVLGSMAFLGAAAGIAYTAFAIKRVRDFRNGATPDGSTAFTPAVTVFKPLHGMEPQLYENLRSFCDQEYAQYQVIFGANDPNDAALDVARRLQREFSQHDIVVVAGAPARARNPKVANLMAMRQHARHEIFIIADSDMRAGRDYLRTIVAPFADAAVGAVTCLYGGTPDGTIAAQLGAMHVNDQFSPSVLVATALEPLTYCFGATMAVRQDVLENAGGFEALRDRLGDDYALGKLVTESGKRIELSHYVVHTTIADDNFHALWLHELRWARTILSQRTAGYAGSIVTFPLPLAILAAALAPSPFSFAAIALAAALRTLLHFESRDAFARHVRATPWLIPVRDALGVAIWVTAFLGKRVRWRDARFRVEAGGQMAGRP